MLVATEHWHGLHVHSGFRFGFGLGLCFGFGLGLWFGFGLGFGFRFVILRVVLPGTCSGLGKMMYRFGSVPGTGDYEQISIIMKNDKDGVIRS